MGTTDAQIGLWRQSPSECQRLEFKEAKTQFDNHKLHEHCVALANEGGGHLLLGVVSDLQANWARRQTDDCVRIQVGLHRPCTSAILHDWQDQGTHAKLFYLNCDRPEGAQV